MSSIVKTLLTISAGAGIATGAVVAKKHSKALGHPEAIYSQSVSPIIIYRDGTVSFLDRIPPAAVVTEIQTAAKNNDIESLNTQLIKYRFYAIPEEVATSVNH